ncbi:MAG: dipeptidase [Chitinophagaceae bacterium]|nr:dipeptidase [Chitinophagaceae bacterium]
MKLFFCLTVCFFTLHANAQNYKAVHEQAVVVDTHNDILSTAIEKKLKIDENLIGKTHSDVARFKKGGIDVQVFSIFCDETFGKGTAFKFANREIDSLYTIVARNPGSMMIVSTPAELAQALEQKKLACMIGVEGGHMIEDRLDYLDSLFKRGARYLTLTWNNSTGWATSAKDESAAQKEAKPLPHTGLNDFGKTVVKKMNDLGMMVDLSHVGVQTFWDAIQATTKPVILSHSSVYKLCPVPRNVTDEQIKAVAKNGGVIQVNFYSGFLDSNYLNRRKALFAKHQAEMDSLKKQGKGEYEIDDWIAHKYRKDMEKIRPPFSSIIDHIDYIVKLVGVDYVGIGADMDGVESLPQGINGIQDFPKITRALLAKGYSVEDINKIMGGNFIRVFKANSN